MYIVLDINQIYCSLNTQKGNSKNLDSFAVLYFSFKNLLGLIRMSPNTGTVMTLEKDFLNT
jgi:hypothetical protein